MLWLHIMIGIRIRILGLQNRNNNLFDWNKMQHLNDGKNEGLNNMVIHICVIFRCLFLFG